VIRFVSLTTLFSLIFATGCQRAASLPETPPADPLTVDGGPLDLPGLHNVCRVSDKLLSGGSPEADDGFATLQKLQVHTIISVDGSRPDVDRARKFGMRYVHLPIGYDGVPRDQALRLARAVRDLPGQVYLHCHHGKHRGPAAAAAVHRCLDGRCTADAAVAELKRAGTAANYTGLYAAARQFELVPTQELDKVPADFPEVTPAAHLVQIMVDVDERWDHLKLIRAASWKTPANHADLEPAHEALLLRERYREAARLAEVKQRSVELLQWFTDAETAAGELESVLRAAKEKGTLDTTAVENAYRRAAASCAHCHAKYRDVPAK
jgi:hypothetical protein